MSSSSSIRTTLTSLAKKRAGLEKKRAAAQKKQASKEREAADKRAKAAKTRSASSAAMYLRQADAALKIAHAEADKVAKLSNDIAAVVKTEGDKTKALHDAVDRETRQERQATERAGRDRARREKQERTRERDEDRAYTDGAITAAEDRITDKMLELKSPTHEPLRVLYATASSKGDLRVDQEIRRVRNAVRASTHRDFIKIEHLAAATPGDLLDGLTRFKPHVVHFSGHANTGLLVFDTDTTNRNPGHRVSASAFKRALAAQDQPPTLVVLNACKSAAQLNELTEVVPVAVGMLDSVNDSAAIHFATRFYATLAEGNSITSALDNAKADMEFNGFDHADLPTCVAHPDADPAQLRLILAE